MSAPFRLPRRRRRIIIPDHAPDIVRRALLSAVHGTGVYAPLIGTLTQQGVLQPGPAGGAPRATAKGRAALNRGERLA